MSQKQSANAVDWIKVLQLLHDFGGLLANNASKEQKLSFDDWLLLVRLDYVEESVTMKQLGELVGYQPSRLSNRIKALEELGMISRSVNPLDSRSLIVELTAKASRIVKQTRAKQEQMLDLVYGSKFNQSQAKQFEALIDVLLSNKATTK